MTAYRGDLVGVAARLAASEGLAMVELRLTHLTKEALRAAFAAWWAADHAKTSVIRTWSAWNSFFAWLVAEDLIEGNPKVAVTKPKRPKAPVKVIRGPEATSLLLRAAETTDPRARWPWPEWDLALAATFAVTGLRLAEALSLTIGSLDGPPGERRVTVTGKGDRARAVPVYPELEDVIGRYLASRAARFPDHDLARPTTPLFVDARGRRLTPRQAQYAIERPYVRTGGDSGAGAAGGAGARPEAHVRDQVGRRGQRARGAAAAGSRQPRHHPPVPRGDRQRAPRRRAGPPGPDRAPRARAGCLGCENPGAITQGPSRSPLSGRLRAWLFGDPCPGPGRRADAVTRARRPEDWARDLASARDVESLVASALQGSGLVSELEDHTADFDRLDFSFIWKGGRVWLDVKEKRQRYSSGIGALWPERRAEDLFVIDETVYRRIVWQGGGGYLAVHDVPGGRWAYFGPWELTLGPRTRYNRWIEKASGNRLRKGKILLDLSTAPVIADSFSVEPLARSWTEPDWTGPARRHRDRPRTPSGCRRRSRSTLR